MKQKSILVGMCMLMLSICACTNEAKFEIEESENVNTDTVLLKVLEDYNKSISNSIPHTRGAAKTSTIVFADIAGGLTGGYSGIKVGRTILSVTGGTGLHLVGMGVLAWTVFSSARSSYSAYKMITDLCSVEYPMQNFKNSDTQIGLYGDFYDQITNYTAYDSSGSIQINDTLVYSEMGKLHNALLAAMIDKDSHDILRIPRKKGHQGGGGLGEPDFPKIPSKVLQYNMNSYGISAISDVYVESYCVIDQQGIIAFCNDGDYNKFINRLKTNGYISNNVGSIINLLYEAISLVEDGDTTIQEIVDVYMSYVNNSNNLTSEEKTIIFQCLGIAKYSYQYWNTHSDIVSLLQ